MNTPSLSKTKVVHPNHGDGKFTWLGRANPCGNLSFSNDVRSYQNGQAALAELRAKRVERFVGRQNIEHFREMLKITVDPGQRQCSRNCFSTLKPDSRKTKKITKRI